MQAIPKLLGSLALAILLGEPRAAPAAVVPGDAPAGLANPFIRMHAQDPVEWHAWTPETLALARREGRPIFLSIGFSACFWCDAMERESFADPGVASLMNGWFVNVLVDASSGRIWTGPTSWRPACWALRRDGRTMCSSPPI